ncbi:MAG: hypothetical protein P4L33_06640 [Capsulimonadaceae bacterium]|nr:hypothetical protein [Capsulimonadaceae bacterium]
MTISDALLPGDVIRRCLPEQPADRLDLYLGNGRMGGCFDSSGLMRPVPANEHNAGALMHTDHWHRDALGYDHWMPLARLRWSDPQPALQDEGYLQRLSLYDGTLRTDGRTQHGRFVVTSTFHPHYRDILLVELEYEATTSAQADILLDIVDPKLGDPISTSVDSLSDWETPGVAGLRIRSGSSDTAVALSLVSQAGSASMQQSRAGMRITFDSARGRHLLCVGVSSYGRRHELDDQFARVLAGREPLADAAAAWHRRWGSSYVRIDNAQVQSLWARSMFQLLATHAPEPAAPAAPMGWSGNGWDRHFPQDISFLQPAFLATGHHDIARAIVEFYRSRLDEARDAARRTWNVDGAFFAWEHPIGPGAIQNLEAKKSPYVYQIHNAACPAYIAYETSRYLADPTWTRDVAWPIVREATRFFTGLLKRDGAHWGIHVTPSMGQDEFGGMNAPNYLCALFAAQFTLAAAASLGRELDAAKEDVSQWELILKYGLAFPKLLNAERGIYGVSEAAAGGERFGLQKHPIQLTPLTYLPAAQPDAPTMTAYRARHTLCDGDEKGFMYGWTQASYWLAAANAGDGDGLDYELNRTLAGKSVDAEALQHYEATNPVGGAYFITNAGVFVRAIVAAIVRDANGEASIGGAAPQSWGDIEFSRVSLPNNRRVSGRRTNGRWESDA